MTHAVVFSTGARQDLFKIYRYIKNAGRPETARDLVQRMTEACESLSESPERGHVPLELEGLSTPICRQLVIKNYRIIYKIIGQAVVILGIVDGRRSIREVMQQRLLI
jgi:toxin ParE1/3/4